MRINTNIVSQRTQENLRLNQTSMNQAMNRLSSGSRINSAADDAAGLAISTRMNVSASGLEVASRNSADAISLLETVESALDSITSILIRMRDLALAANNDPVGDGFALIDTEYTELAMEIQRIAETTTFNGINILMGDGDEDTHRYTPGRLSIQVTSGIGDNSTIDISLHNASLSGIGLDEYIGFLWIKDLHPDVDMGGFLALSNDRFTPLRLDRAIDRIAGMRAENGASMNRLSFNIANVNNQRINTEQAASRIADADMAAEMSEMTRARILTEASVSMLSQANQTPQMVSRLLQ